MRLSFRETGISRQTRRRLLLLLIIFLVSVFVFEVIFNYEKTEATEDLNGPTLPTVSVGAYGYDLAEMHGYKTEMDGCYMRDMVVPLSTDRRLPITIHTYGREVTGISYEIRSNDTTRKIAETDISDLLMTDGTDVLAAEPQLENLVEKGEEYLLVLTLTVDGDPLYYYTRIELPENDIVKRCMNFAENFHDTALSDDYESLSTYLESADNANTKTYAHVTIASTIRQVGWRGFKGEVSGDVRYVISDITSESCTVMLQYQMVDGQSVASIYNVEEYFKIRKGIGRMYLLDYERNMEQILSDKNLSAEANVFKLGVRPEKVSLLANETGTVMAFEQAGDLYEYSETDRVATRIFSFRGENPYAERENFDAHGIKLLNIDENGSLDFCVYGYINSGAHEGYCGVNLYRYDAVLNQCEEEAFVASTKSYAVLDAGFTDLIYKNSDEYFYIMVDGTLVKIDLTDNDTEELLTGLTREQYAPSKSGRRIAWCDDPEGSQDLHVMDLENESKFNISAKKKKTRLLPLGYLDENLVYGAVREADISTNAAGSPVYPIYRIIIRDTETEDGEVLKEYEKKGRYISDVAATESALNLTLVRKQGGTFVPAGEDSIQDSAADLNRAIVINTAEEDWRGEILLAEMAQLSKETTGEIRTREAGYVAKRSSGVVVVKASDTHTNYLVYVGSRVTLSTQDIAAAIKKADKGQGIVVDNKQNTIWKRSRAGYVNTFLGVAPADADRGLSGSRQAVSAMLSVAGEGHSVRKAFEKGGTPIRVLKKYLPDCTVLDLTGIKLEQALYFVNEKAPVYARVGGDNAFLIIGYDSVNITVYDPLADATREIPIEEAERIFEDHGNVFISYLQ